MNHSGQYTVNTGISQKARSVFGLVVDVKTLLSHGKVLVVVFLDGLQS